MIDKIRYGIIGVGTQGKFYADFLADIAKPLIAGKENRDSLQHCTLGALCDIDPSKVLLCKEKYPEYPFFSDWKEMIVSGTVDAVITTVPHYLHTEIAIACLEKGMPVLVEKPAGVYGKAVSEMNACAVAHANVSFGIMFNQRMSAIFTKVKNIVQSGELGEIRRSSWIINSWWRPDSYYRQSDWRATWGGEGGGVLVNQAPHQLDLWQWICGVPNKVYAKCLFGCHRDIIVENDVTVVTEYPNGSTGSFITCTHDPIGTDRLEITLDKGKIIVENSKSVVVQRLNMSEQEMNDSMSFMEVSELVRGNSGGSSLYTTEIFEGRDIYGEQHLKVMENFACNILSGEPLLAPGSDGINGVNLANAILLSSWLGKEVELPVDENIYLVELNKRIAEENKFSQR